MAKIIGIDIGGTTIKADVYTEKGVSLNDYKEVDSYVDYYKQSNSILEQVCCLVDNYSQKYDIDGVGISTAGVVNSQTGEIVYAGYTIPDYIGTNFIKTIKNRFRLPVSVENDVNCASLGEVWIGNVKGLSTVVMITIGTGIGGSIIVNDHILNGHHFTAGEVGYLPIKGQDWQNIASTTALVRLYEQKSGKSLQNGRSFFADIEKGDPIAKETLDIFIDNLTDGILTISYLLNPDTLVVGGGIFTEPTLLLSKIKDSLTHKVQDIRFLPERIVTASLGNAAGRIGAVKHFLDQHPMLLKPVE